MCREPWSTKLPALAMLRREWRPTCATSGARSSAEAGRANCGWIWTTGSEVLAVGLEATVADDEAFEEVGDGPVDERLWPGARHGDGQLEGCEGQVFREGERAATGVGGGALESDGPRSDIVGGDELDFGGAGVVRVAGTKFGGDD